MISWKLSFFLQIYKKYVDHYLYDLARSWWKFWRICQKNLMDFVDSGAHLIAVAEQRILRMPCKISYCIYSRGLHSRSCTYTGRRCGPAHRPEIVLVWLVKLCMHPGTVQVHVDDSKLRLLARFSFFVIYLALLLHRRAGPCQNPLNTGPHFCSSLAQAGLYTCITHLKLDFGAVEGRHRWHQPFLF